MYYWFVFHQGTLLLKRNCQGAEALPSGTEPPCPIPQDSRLFRFNTDEGFEAHCFHAAEAASMAGYEWVPLRQSFPLLGPSIHNIAGKGAELTWFDEHTRFCSHCGAPLMELTPISKVCPQCHQEFWPQLSVAVIVLIRRGRQALLVRAKNFRKHFFGLVAGFVETGETLEEALQREVREETGLHICNLRYHYSQPWPYPSGLMIGYFADYESGELCIDESELIEGNWFDRDNLPPLPDPCSIARRLIEEWIAEV